MRMARCRHGRIRLRIGQIVQKGRPKGSEMPDFEAYADPHDADEWCEEDGPVLWWRLPVNEPPYVGTPLDDDWIEGYFTHWTRLPQLILRFEMAGEEYGCP